MKIRFIWWDWKEQINVKELQAAIEGVFDGKQLPGIIEIDSSSDAYVLVVSNKIITREVAQALFDHYDQMSYDDSPNAKILEIPDRIP